MKLLIVDDEEITRNGLVSAINGMELPISEIKTADDGVSGLDVLRSFHPDIVLSDVRMPRKDGLSMIADIQEIAPETCVILMSGYSDREYLKAAIRLKAVSFVEKPVDFDEIRTALLDAIEESRAKNISREHRLVHSLARANELALELTSPLKDDTDLSTQTLSDIKKGLTSGLYFTTYIIKSTRSLELIGNNKLHDMHTGFSAFLNQMHMDQIHVIKHDQYLIYHIFSQREPETSHLNRIGEHLKNELKDTNPFFIAAGKTVSGIENVYKSYNSAVILLQSSFFYDFNCVLISGDNENLTLTNAVSDYSANYRDALISKESDRICKVEDMILASFSDNHSLLPNQVKDMYYRLFIVIDEVYRELSIHGINDFSRDQSVIDLVQNTNTLSELHALLKQRSASLLSAVNNATTESPVIHSIKNFINLNYSRENLSVKEISDHVHMTQTYVCTLFKNETGQTLNQFITAFRMNKAKQLLADSNYKISDVSQKVGYTDGNYFGKSFKKVVGLTPSEYRDKILL
ncbi:MAG: response regulator [Lachnospiraceae bacterium]|nr:response regulator [Lachnospiraceae bacterium]